MVSWKCWGLRAGAWIPADWLLAGPGVLTAGPCICPERSSGAVGDSRELSRTARPVTASCDGVPWSPSQGSWGDHRWEPYFCARREGSQRPRPPADAELVLPTIRSAVEKQLNLIAQGRADFRQVLGHTLDVFKRKFHYFVDSIAGECAPSLLLSRGTRLRAVIPLGETRSQALAPGGCRDPEASVVTALGAHGSSHKWGCPRRAVTHRQGLPAQ